jgi:hypothetical protein
VDKDTLKRWSTKLLAHARNKTDLHSNNDPTDGTWMPAHGAAGVALT